MKQLVCSKCKKKIAPGENYSTYPAMKKTFCDACEKKAHK